MQEGKYNIKAVSKLLGIQPGTLRAWERRYQFIAPERNESGHRLYNDQHIKILKELVDKTRQGFTISQAVALLDHLEEGPEKEEMDAVGSQTSKYATQLLEALLSFDEEKAQDLINQSFSLFAIEKAAIDILGAALVNVGDLWEKGEITTAHEHFASNLLKSRISSLMYTFPVNPALPKAVLVCGPEERHEFGLMVFTLYLRRLGYRTVYLGASLAPGDIHAVLDTVQPAFLFLSCSMEEHREAAAALTGDLQKAYPDLKIGIGGAGCKTGFPDGMQLGDTAEEWRNWLFQR